jgi:hypothetical protein
LFCDKNDKFSFIVLCTLFYVCRYIPNISKALFSVLQKMGEKAKDKNSALTAATAIAGASASGAVVATRQATSSQVLQLLLDVSKGALNEEKLSEHLHKAVDKFEKEAVLLSSQLAAAAHDGAGGAGAGASLKRPKLFLQPDTRVFEIMLPAVLRAASEAKAAADAATTAVAFGDSSLDTAVTMGVLPVTLPTASLSSSQVIELSDSAASDSEAEEVMVQTQFQKGKGAGSPSKRDNKRPLSLASAGRAGSWSSQSGNSRANTGAELVGQAWVKLLLRPVASTASAAATAAAQACEEEPQSLTQMTAVTTTAAGSVNGVNHTIDAYILTNIIPSL